MTPDQLSLKYFFDYLPIKSFIDDNKPDGLIHVILSNQKGAQLAQGARTTPTLDGVAIATNTREMLFSFPFSQNPSDIYIFHCNQNTWNAFQAFMTDTLKEFNEMKLFDNTLQDVLQ